MKKKLLKNYLQLSLYVLTVFFSFSSFAQTTQTFNSSGSWVCPAGVTSVFVETWGAGGAGGGIATSSTGGAGGGGGGSFSESVVTVTPGVSYDYIVGVGGVGSRTAGVSGGSSSFNALVVAQGGIGGAAGPSGNGGAGGAGYDYNGGAGFAGTSGTRSGAGGGGAGSGASGANASNITGGNGGAGGGGVGGIGSTSSSNGASGTTLGGGGGGAFATSAAGFNGGNGANGQVRLTYCSTILTNIANVTGTSFNWSTASNWSLGHVPVQCENVEINVTRVAFTNETVTLTIPSFSVQNLTIRNRSISIYQVLVAANVASSSTVNIYGNLTVETVGGAVTGNRNNRTSLNCSGSTVNIYGDVTLGRPAALSSVAREGHATISGNPCTWNIYGDMTFNPRGYNTNQGAIFNMNSGGTQYLINNTNPAVYNDTIKGNRFQTLNIGNTNPTTVILGGTNDDFSISSVIAGDLNVGVNSTLDIPANYSFNLVVANPMTTANFRLLAGARLRLGGDQSLVTADGTNLGVAGSNFPGGYDFYTLDPTSTVEYYGSNAITQTIFNGVTYGNLLALNGSGSGRAVKQTTAGTLNVATSFNINSLTDVYLGTATGLGTNTAPVTNSGPLNINATGGLYCNANVVSGAGTFTMGAGSFLGMGHPQGISNSGSATGNIQMTGGRSYNATGNYIYNGLVAQVTGAGLPSGGINDLTIDNPTTVTIATTQTVNGANLLKQGVFDIAANKIIINGTTGILNSTGGKMKANVGTVEMKGTSGTAQNLSGSWFVNKTISSLINANTRGITVAASPADTLLISTEMYYGSGITNSSIATNDNLTLLSRSTGTARFGEIVTGSGNTITGRVNIERFLPARKSWRFLAAPIKNATAPTVTAAWREGGSMAATGYGTRITGPATFVGMDEFSQRASMKYYNGATNKYIDVTNSNTTNISNAQGYYIFVRGDRNVSVSSAITSAILRIKGEIITGPQTVSVLPLKYQSFGNPYPSRINVSTIVKSNIVNAFTVWDPNAVGNYSVGGFFTYTWNGTNYVKPGGVIRNTIESGEAVFIKSNSATAGLITINESDKVGGSSVQSRTSESGRNGQENAKLEITMFTKNVDSTTYLADGVWLNFNNEYVDGIDNEDVNKFSNAVDNFSIKKQNDLLIVERRSELKLSDTIQFNLSNTRVNPYYFEIEPTSMDYPELKPVLKDKFLNKETELSFTNSTRVDFNITTAEGSRAADRFLIYFKQAPAKFKNINADRITKNSVNVKWIVENENSINNYTVEQSNDGISFSTIATQAATSNNGSEQNYKFTDINASGKATWYRINATDANGSKVYSDIVKVEENELLQKNIVKVNPNPVVEGKVNIYFTDQALGKYTLSIVTMNGQIIANELITVNTNNFSKTINIGSAATGTYKLKITGADDKAKTVTFFVK